MFVYAKMEPINSNNWTKQHWLYPRLIILIAHQRQWNKRENIEGRNIKYTTTANQTSCDDDKFCNDSNFQRKMGKRERERKKWNVNENRKEQGNIQTNSQFNWNTFCNWNMKYVIRILFCFLRNSGIRLVAFCYVISCVEQFILISVFTCS